MKLNNFLFIEFLINCQVERLFIEPITCVYMTEKEDRNEVKLEELNIDEIQEVKKFSKIKYTSFIIFLIFWVLAFKILENSKLYIAYLQIIWLFLLIVFIFLYVFFINYLNSFLIVCDICKGKMRKIGEKKGCNIFICPNKHLIKTRRLIPSIFSGGVKVRGL